MVDRESRTITPVEDIACDVLGEIECRNVVQRHSLCEQERDRRLH